MVTITILCDYWCGTTISIWNRATNNVGSIMDEQAVQHAVVGIVMGLILLTFWPKIKPWLCKIGWHKWILVREMGVHTYYQCKRCQRRKSKRAHLGWGPVDQDWLDGKKPNPGVDTYKVMDDFVDDIVISLTYDMYDVFEMGQTSYRGHTEIMKNYQALPDETPALERKTLAVAGYVRNKTKELLKEITGEDIQCG